MSQTSIQAPLVVGTPFAVVYKNQQHNLYQDVNGNISDIWYDESNWNYQNLNTLRTDAPQSQGSPFAIVYGNQQHNLYLDVNGKISDIWYDGSNWHYQNLNTLRTDAPLSQGNPFAVVYKNQQHNLYLDLIENISDIWFDGSKWNYQNLSNFFPSVLQMLMISSGYVKAPYIDPYNLQNQDFTLTVMVQPTSQGTIISTSSLELSLNSKGAIEFSVYRSNSPVSVITDSMSIINSKQCHIITCLAPVSQQPSIYLDGQLLSTTSQTASTPPPSNQAVLIGNNAAQNNQYNGGLMNIGLWNRILSKHQSTLSGYGQIAELGLGPVAYWYLNSSLKDRSVYSNDLQPGVATFSYMTCLNCINLYGPNSYSFCQIEGRFQPGDVKTINYTQTIRVGNDAVALFGTVIDNSGFARFPEGVFVRVTDPNGKIYNQDENPTDGSVFVKTHEVSGHATNSLFGLLVNKVLLQPV